MSNSNLKKIILWGGTGQAIVLEEILSKNGFEIIALFDNREISSPFKNIPIFYKKQGFYDWKKKNSFKNLHCAVAIGGDHGKERFEIQNFFKKLSIIPVTIIHDTASVANSANIGEGCQILANSSIRVRAKLGKATIINTSASVGHECVIGKGCHMGELAFLRWLGKVSISGSRSGHSISKEIVLVEVEHSEEDAMSKSTSKGINQQLEAEKGKVTKEI